jgi:hypothetical protein
MTSVAVLGCPGGPARAAVFLHRAGVSPLLIRPHRTHCLHHYADRRHDEPDPEPAISQHPDSLLLLPLGAVFLRGKNRDAKPDLPHDLGLVVIRDKR